MATVKLRAFKIINKFLSEPNSKTYSLLVKALEKSEIAKNRCMLINSEDKNKEQDLISYFQDEDNQKFVFCTMLRIALGSDVQHVTEKLFAKQFFTIDDLGSQDLDTAAIYKSHYYFALSDDYVVTNLPLTTTIARLQTYINWFIKPIDAPIEISPIIDGEAFDDLSAMESIVIRDPINKENKNEKSADTENRTIQLIGAVLDGIKHLLVDTKNMDEVKLSQVIEAELKIKFKKPKDMTEEEYKNILSAQLKPVSDLDHITFKTEKGNTLKSGKDILRIKTITVDTTESGKISEQNLLQEMGKFLLELKDEEDIN